MGDYRRENVAALVDHTLLKPEATEDDIARLVDEAAELRAYAICVSPSMVSVAKRSGAHDKPIAAVVGFPSGKHLSAIKAQEARLAVAAGAAEIDMVIDVGAAVSGDFTAVAADVAAVRAAIGQTDRPQGDRGVGCVAQHRGGAGARLCMPGRRGCRGGLREDLHRVPSSRRRLGAGSRADARDRRPSCRGQGQRRHPHDRRRGVHARRRCDPAGTVRNPVSARWPGWDGTRSCRKLEVPRAPLIWRHSQLAMDMGKYVNSSRWNDPTG